MTTTEFPDQSTKRWVLAITSIGSLMVILDAMVVATALSTIRRDLGASIEALEWTMNAYNLSFAVLLLTGAALGDRFGRRKMFTSGIALFAVASVACALSRDAGGLIAARALQGAGAALVMPLAMALLSTAYPPAERGKALGIFSSITGLALIIGPVVGGAIAQGLAWQWIFWINIPVALVLIPLIRRVPESVGPTRRIDFGGVGLVTTAALGLVWGLMRGNAAGWSSPVVLGSLAAAAIFAVLFVIWELRASEPMVPMRFFRARIFSSGILVTFLLYAAMYSMVFFLPQFLQVAQRNGPLSAGLRLLPWTATLFVVAPIAGGLVNRFGERALIVVGMSLQTAGMAWIAAIATPDVAYLRLVPALVLTGCGVSMTIPAAQNGILRSVERSEVGKASGVFNMFRFLGGVSGVAVTAAFFAAHGSFQSREAFGHGFAVVMAVAAAFSGLSTLAGTTKS